MLDRPPFEKAQILVAGRNFGCGSSREQAVWALADFGIRCVIAPSFGEIFFANCFRNGVLAVDLAEDPHRRVMSAASTEKPMTVDLESQAIRLPDGESVAFRVDPHRRRALLLRPRSNWLRSWPMTPPTSTSSKPPPGLGTMASSVSGKVLRGCESARQGSHE